MEIKLPTFRFYANDFLGSTAEMELESIGAYIRLLCYEWINGGIPKDKKKIARLLAVDGSAMARLWQEIGSKFVGDGDRLVNKRLEKIREEAISFNISLSERGKIGAEARWRGHATANATANAQAMPENAVSVSVSVSESESLGKGRGRGRFAPPTLTEVKAFWQTEKLLGDSEAFFNYFESKGWVVGRSPMKNWFAAARNWSRNEIKLKGGDKSIRTMDRISSFVDKYEGVAK